MNSQYNKVITIVICVCMFLFSIIFVFSKKYEFSENENRYLEDFPRFKLFDFFDGEYTESLKRYVSDHFPFRDSLMGIKSKVELMNGKNEINNVFVGSDGYLMERYLKPRNTEKIISKLNQFYRDLNYVNMSLMLVPTSVTVNEDKLPRNAVTYSQAQEIKKYYDSIIFDTVDVTSTLIEKNKDYQIFYKLDHHWTTYGAYYAYVEYCNHNEIEYASILDFDIEEVSSNFNGTLYSKTSLYDLNSDSIYLFIPEKNNYSVNYVFNKKVTDTLYVEDYLDKKDQYSLFLDNNHPLIVITNLDQSNGKEIVVIKDSYANSFVPFLVQHYEKVHVIDPRFYKESIKEYIRSNDSIRDLLFLYNMNTIDSDTGIMTIH